ncbi:MAG TPA: restriction endonuclease [Kiritimatiellia bacterium]|nr:restriction endonuclease [Kiritimatiellia bacterium]HPS08618.1 restriction endonuclease [Kiritimatiellia bacterium]
MATGWRDRVARLAIALRELTEQQLHLIEIVVAQFRRPFLEINRYRNSDLVSEQLLRDFGDVLRFHHCVSKEALSKDRFEYALEKTLNMGGVDAELVGSRTNRGHDITIQGVPFSLKTQADKSIKETEIYISKFMELGKGRWPKTSSGLEMLRDMFFEHMKAYDRIFTLRCLSKDPTCWRYELVEIPKTLLLEAQKGKFEICRKTKQETRPGYCRVIDPDGNLRFELYFDAGSERKLQVRHLRKDLCIVHAQWSFATA